MKKLYRKGTVHPSPPIISDHLSFLPATILTLTAALSPQDREVLAYLISCSNHPNISKKKSFCSNSNEHLPSFNCDCFTCYLSYWIRWDSSPNRHLIHEIIDAFEDGLLAQGNRKSNHKNKKGRKRKGNSNSGSESSSKDELGHQSVGESSNCAGDEGGGEGEGSEKGSVRRFVSYIGERIWGVTA